MKKNIVLIFVFQFLVAFQFVNAQEDLEKMLDAEKKPERVYAQSAFKGTRVINLHSLERTKTGTLQFLIQHRFGAINTGAYQFFGLDQATIRLALEYGLSDRIMVGLGRSSYQKNFDAFTKISLIKQQKGIQNIPFSLLYFGSITLNSLKWEDPNRTNYFSSRLSFVHQLIIGSKINERFSCLLAPSIIHRNLVEQAIDQNTVYALGVGARYKITKRTCINAEYVYRVPPANTQALSYANYYNSLSLGVDIETGGHVFQLHITNSQSMIEKGFLSESSQSWEQGGIYPGFNISRDFTIRNKTKKTLD
jgi:hypothetical protein